MSLHKLQDMWWNGTLFIELSEEQLLDLTGRVRDALLFVAIAVGLRVEDLRIYPAIFGLNKIKKS